MGLHKEVDYVYSPLVRNILDDGVLVGTKEYVAFIPSKIREYTTQSINEKTYTLDGMTMSESVEVLLQDTDMTTNELHSVLLDWQEQQEGMKILRVAELQKFKVKGGALNSAVYYQESGDAGWSLLCNSLGKPKKEIASFYDSFQKL